MKDNFSKQAALYASCRPGYPRQLFDFIFQQVKNKTTAWDCGTGNGQTARELAHCFDKVLATDISRQQLDNAYKAGNIAYSVQPAEQTDFADKSIDLVTVSQALHWFQFEKFYAEVSRVSRAGSWLSVWTYSLLRISPGIDKIIERYHFETLGPYWDKERSYVDKHYTTLPFPFPEIEVPVFSSVYYWSLEALQGYLNTWSALQKFITANDHNPVPGLIKTIAPFWNAEKMKVTFPLYMRMGRTG